MNKTLNNQLSWLFSLMCLTKYNSLVFKMICTYFSSCTDPAFKDTAEPTISSDYVQVLNDTFKAVTQPLTWDVANTHCESDGSRLAGLQSEWSQIYVELVALTLKTPVWIGMNKDKVKGREHWSHFLPLYVSGLVSQILSKFLLG